MSIKKAHAMTNGCNLQHGKIDGRGQSCLIDYAINQTINQISLTHPSTHQLVKIIGIGASGRRLVVSWRGAQTGYFNHESSIVNCDSDPECPYDLDLSRQRIKSITSTWKNTLIRNEVLGYDRIILAPDFASRMATNLAFQFLLHAMQEGVAITTAIITDKIVVPNLAAKIINASRSILRIKDI